MEQQRNPSASAPSAPLAEEIVVGGGMFRGEFDPDAEIPAAVEQDYEVPTASLVPGQYEGQSLYYPESGAGDAGGPVGGGGYGAGGPVGGGGYDPLHPAHYGAVGHDRLDSRNNTRSVSLDVDGRSPTHGEYTALLNDRESGNYDGRGVDGRGVPKVKFYPFCVGLVVAWVGMFAVEILNSTHHDHPDGPPRPVPPQPPQPPLSQSHSHSQSPPSTHYYFATSSNTNASSSSSFSSSSSSPSAEPSAPRALFEPLHVNPWYGPRTCVLLDAGAIAGPPVIGFSNTNTNAFADGEDSAWWRLASSPFVHAGAMHLLLDIVCLVLVARPLERAFGPWRVALVAFLGGSLGGLASIVVLPREVVVGGCAWLAALLGSHAGVSWGETV